MKYLLRSLFLIVLLLQSCDEEPWLSGNLKMTKGENWKPMVYVVHPENFESAAQSFMGKVLDSAQIDEHGHFEFNNNPVFQEPVLLEIVVQKEGEKYPTRLLNNNPESDNYFPLVYKTGVHIIIEADIAHFQSSFSIQGPDRENKAMLELRDLRSMAHKKHLKNQKDGHGADEDLLEREKKQYDFQKELIDFADTTEELFPAMVALRWASPAGDYERIAELAYKQSRKWKNLHPEHPWTKEFASLTNKRNLPILVGDIIPDLKLPMKGDEQVSLKEMLKNKKLLLLDVWASWCAPCRVENRNVLVPLWEKYNADDFQIIAYGLESSEKAWDMAIQKDGAYRWVHASHLQGDQNSFMETLRLKTIPANFLLDSEGRVLEKNLHGQDLIDFVDGYMSNP
nr:TlpA disulfide reductase family protein [uncultured Allomuricauda sp.]